MATRFQQFCNEVGDALEGVKLDHNNMDYKMMPDANTGLIARLTVGEIPFLFTVEPDDELRNYSVGCVCELPDGYDQNTDEINTANCEINGVKFQYNKEDNVIFIIVDFFRPFVDNDNYLLESIEVGIGRILDALETAGAKGYLSIFSD